MLSTGSLGQHPAVTVFYIDMMLPEAISLMILHRVIHHVICPLSVTHCLLLPQVIILTLHLMCTEQGRTVIPLHHSTHRHLTIRPLLLLQPLSTMDILLLLLRTSTRSCLFLRSSSSINPLYPRSPISPPTVALIRSRGTSIKILTLPQRATSLSPRRVYFLSPQAIIIKILQQ